MTNEDGKNPVVARHLEALANAAKNYTLAELANISGGANDFTGATSIAGGLSGLVPAPSIGDENKFLRGDGSWSDEIILPTGASSVDGGFWLDVSGDIPVPKFFFGGAAYVFGGASGVSIDSGNAGSTLPAELVAYLPFDESATADLCGNVWTATGNTSLDSSVKKFGAASIHFPSGAYLSATNILDLNADKWTFDAWIRVDTANERAVQLGGSAQSIAGIVFANSGVYIANDAGTGWQQQLELVQVGWQNLYIWFHAAIVKDGSSLTFFVNGTKTHTCTLSSQIFNTGAVALGGNSEWARCDVYFQHVRFFEGVALWTDDFTPPTASDYD